MTMEHSQTPLSSSDPAEAAGERPVLLVVALLPLPRDVLGMALSSSLPHWRVFTASNVVKAQQACGDTPPSVVLLDIGVHHMHLHWGAEMKSIWPQSPILVLDESMNDVLIRLSLSLDLAGYITKEYPLESLLTSIHEAAAGHKVFSPSVASRLRATAGGLRLVENHPTPWSKLTARELDVLSLITQGHSVASAAKMLGISPATVDNHKTRLMQKLGIHKATQLAAWAVSVGLVTSLSNQPGARHLEFPEPAVEPSPISNPLPTSAPQ